MSNKSKTGTPKVKHDKDLRTKRAPKVATQQNQLSGNSGLLIPLPIAGMKVTPYMWGDPLMSGAYMAHLQWVVGRREIREQFKAESGMDLDRVLVGSGIERMVDKATGYDGMVVAAFADWVTEWYWGTDSRE